MNNEIICRADIRREKKKINFIIWYALVGIVVVIGSIPASKTYEGKYLSEKKTYYRFLFADLVVKHEDITVKEDGYYFTWDSNSMWQYIDTDEELSETVEYIKEDCDEFVFRQKGETLPNVTCKNNVAGWLILCSFVIIVLLIPIIRSKILSSIAGHCSLELSNKGISGARKKLFSTKEVNLPIDKIDSITCATTLSDKFSGGKTVSIRSVSGLISFPWVQNSEEFVDATLTKIEEYKRQGKGESKIVNSVDQNTMSMGNSSSATKIKELKELYDAGLISQDEFEVKRKELLEKM